MLKVEQRSTTKPSNGNGHSSAAEVLEEALQLPRPVSLWDRLFKWEKNLTVAGRTIEKGWVVPQPLGIALLLVILGGVGSLYWRITDKQVEAERVATQRYIEQLQMLTRLDQALIDKEKHDAERNEELQKRFQNADAVNIVMNRDIQALKIKAGIK